MKINLLVEMDSELFIELNGMTFEQIKEHAIKEAADHPTEGIKLVDIFIADQNIKVAARVPGAGEINSPQLSDNGPAHQIAELPLACPPTDNSSQLDAASPCDSCISTEDSINKGIRGCKKCPL